MTIDQWLNQTTKLLETTSTTARLDVMVLLEHVTGLDRTGLLAHENDAVTPGQEAALKRYFRRRLAGEPLAYLTGSKDFFGLRFIVNPDVLIPRPETEALVEAAVLHLEHGARVLELGTGSGAIAVSLAKYRPDLRITATDISPKAIKTARNNAAIHEVEVEFIESDLFGKVAGRFDAILANLPYGSRQAWADKPGLSFEPALALYSGADGLDLYRRCFAELPDHLDKDGLVLIEHEPDQATTLQDLTELPARTISPFVTLFG